MVLSFQSKLRLIRQRTLVLTASGQNQKKPEKNVSFGRKRKQRSILQRILIAFHAVPAFLQEMSQCQRLYLLLLNHCSAFRSRNQEVKEVQEHAPPSAC